MINQQNNPNAFGQRDLLNGTAQGVASQFDHLRGQLSQQFKSPQDQEIDLLLEKLSSIDKATHAKMEAKVAAWRIAKKLNALLVL